MTYTCFSILLLLFDIDEQHAFIKIIKGNKCYEVLL